MANPPASSLTLSDLPTPGKGRSGWPWTVNGSRLFERGLAWSRISIVTPSYNQGEFLEETIRSVLLQGYPNLEYIVMDGGSTDATPQILGRYESFFSYLSSAPDAGQAAAIDAGFGRAGGEILAWLNSDDLYLPGALFRVAQFFLDHPQYVFGVGDVRRIDDQSREVGSVSAITPNLFLTRNTGNHGWPQPGAFWRRGVYEAAGGLDESFDFCLDRDLFIRICRLGKAARIPGPPLAAFRAHARQKSQTLLDVSRRENALLLERYGTPVLRPLRGLLGQLWRVWSWSDRTRHRLRDG